MIASALHLHIHMNLIHCKMHMWQALKAVNNYAPHHCKANALEQSLQLYVMILKLRITKLKSITL